MSNVTDPHSHRNPEERKELFDAPNQSLADALRSSFSVLKGIMVVLVVLYLFSNVRSISSHEQALKLRLGRLLPGVHEAGLVWAFPFPIDEIVPLPTRKSNDLRIKSHTFHRRDNEIGKPLSFIHRGVTTGLNPSLDGALLTADSGLVHTQWKVTYKFDDVSKYVQDIAGDKIEAAERLITNYVETVGIEIASELNAEELIRTRVDYVQSEMKRRINERLSAIGSGVRVTLVEMYEPTPPIQVREFFDATQRAENIKQQKIRAAEKKRTQILSKAAGAAYPRLIKLLKAMDRDTGSKQAFDAIRAELDQVLMTQAEGEAGRRIKEAGAYRADVVSRMQSDVERYKALLPEYRRNPMMLINRLWEETNLRIFKNSGVEKFYRPPSLKEFRIKVPLDPKQRRIEEKKRLEKKTFDVSKLRPARIVPVGPEYD